MFVCCVPLPRMGGGIGKGDWRVGTVVLVTTPVGAVSDEGIIRRIGRTFLHRLLRLDPAVR